MESGTLSIADLTLWFGRSRAAVNNWTRFDAEPNVINMEEVNRRLLLLEKVIYKKKGEPVVPYTLSSHKRPQFIRELYNAHNDTRVPSRRIAD